MKFRDLRADEIDVRIGNISRTGTGLSLLLYKDARCDMNILDETVKPQNWQRKHYECKGNLYCSVGINTQYKDEDEFIQPVWVWKDDCGAESYTEKEKGEASDSFKRACVNWGIGRELYTSPFIWIKAEDCQIKNDGKTNKCFDDFKVLSIEIKDKKIVGLEIYNNTLKRVVFKMGAQTTAKAPVLCPKCGEEIEPMTAPNGRVWQPEQILKQFGMCKDCYIKTGEANGV